MPESRDMVVPLLRQLHAKMDGMEASQAKEFAHVNQRLDRIEERQKSFSQALAGDSLMGKMVTGDFEQRIEALEAKVKELEGRS